MLCLGGGIQRAGLYSRSVGPVFTLLIEPPRLECCGKLAAPSETYAATGIHPAYARGASAVELPHRHRPSLSFDDVGSLVLAAGRGGGVELCERVHHRAFQLPPGAPTPHARADPGPRLSKASWDPACDRRRCSGRVSGEGAPWHGLVKKDRSSARSARHALYGQWHGHLATALAATLAAAALAASLPTWHGASATTALAATLAAATVAATLAAFAPPFATITQLVLVRAGRQHRHGVSGAVKLRRHVCHVRPRLRPGCCPHAP